MQQPQQLFTLTNMTGDDIQAIMNGMNELPSKLSRATMNKIELQVVAQLRAQQAQQSKEAAAEEVKPGLDSAE